MNTEHSGSAPVRNGILAFNAQAWGLSFGLLLGGGLFLATNILLLKGGPTVGRHLSMLSAFYPGYSVTFLGSLIGFVYAFVTGYILGRVIGGVYNRLAFR